MNRLRALLVAALACLSFSATADEAIVLGLNQSEVSISTNFNGSEIIIFGAVKRETPIPEGPELEVVVTVSGPSAPVTVRRKDCGCGAKCAPYTCPGVCKCGLHCAPYDGCRGIWITEWVEDKADRAGLPRSEPLRRQLCAALAAPGCREKAFKKAWKQLCGGKRRGGNLTIYGLDNRGGKVGGEGD